MGMITAKERLKHNPNREPIGTLTGRCKYCEADNSRKNLDPYDCVICGWHNKPNSEKNK